MQHTTLCEKMTTKAACHTTCTNTCVYFWTKQKKIKTITTIIA